MVKLSEEMIIARTRVSDMAHVKKLNCWGADLTDVSVLRKLHNVEVLSLSVNGITTLADVQDCKNLQELYIRKNKIPDLNEICWLRNLTKLKFLWLEENPAANMYPELYRATVIRNLPQLQKLDNVLVQPDELADALRRGVDLAHPLEPLQDPRYARMPSVPPQDYGNYNGQYDQPPPMMEPTNPMLETRRSFCSLQPPSILNQCQNEPESMRNLDVGVRNNHTQIYERYDESPSRQMNEPNPGFVNRRSQSQHQMPRYVEDEGGPEIHVGRRFSQQEHGVSSTRRHSPKMLAHQQSFDESVFRRMSLQETKYEEDKNSNPEEYSDRSPTIGSRKASNQDVRNYVAQQYEQTYEQVQHQVEAAQQLIEAKRVQDYLANFPKRPKNRNSNLLSAVLCLIRELDSQSLEVAEMAIKCRMQELED